MGVRAQGLWRALRVAVPAGVAATALVGEVDAVVVEADVVVVEVDVVVLEASDVQAPCLSDSQVGIVDGGSRLADRVFALDDIPLMLEGRDTF